MKGIRFVIMCLVAATGPVLAAAQDQTAPPTAEARAAALQELRAKQNALDKLFKPCPVCKGKGKVSDVVCSECGGERRVFTGQLDAELQTHIDNYVGFCELLEKHAAILEAEPAVRDRFNAARSLYLGAITARMGKRPLQNRAIGAQGQAEYRPSKDKVPPYTRLACDLLVASPNKSRGHGLAFDGIVTRLYKAESESLAEIRLESTGGEVRYCYVLVPRGASWTEKSKVRVVGTIVDGTAQRKAFGVEGAHAVVQPCYGTE